MATNFDEKSGIVPHEEPWGRWHQTVDEVVIEVNAESGTRGKEVQVTMEPNLIACVIRGQRIFKVIEVTTTP